LASFLNDACRYVALIDMSGYPADTEGGVRQVRQSECRFAAELEIAAVAPDLEGRFGAETAPLTS
jgi:hypothetical protein